MVGPFASIGSINSKRDTLRMVIKIKMKIEPLPIPTPAAGELVKVNEKIYWLRMPLPFDLDHINLYLLKDVNGWVVLDTGLGTNKTEQIWEHIFSQLDGKVTRVIVTHMHPDHIGMAGYLCEKYRIPLHMSFSEYFVARALVAGPRGADKWQDMEYLRRCGMGEDYIEQASLNKGGIGQVVKPIPLQFNRLVEGQILQIGDIDWKVMIGRGHSPEHVCLYSKALNVLISGDHVLPNITPNIGAYSTEPEINSLSMYLETLEQFYDLPADTTVLPSHKLPFSGLHTRVDELKQHHYVHLDKIIAFCAEARTVKDVLAVMFERELNPHNMFFALAEALSHLNYLVAENKLIKSVNKHGHWNFIVVKK